MEAAEFVRLVDRSRAAGRRWPCRYCPEDFPDREDLAGHVTQVHATVHEGKGKRTVHVVPQPTRDGWECLCGDVFPSEQARAEHRGRRCEDEDEMRDRLAERERLDREKKAREVARLALMEVLRRVGHGWMGAIVHHEDCHLLRRAKHSEPWRTWRQGDFACQKCQRRIAQAAEVALRSAGFEDVPVAIPA